MATRQAVLLCTALWRAINLCHLGSIGYSYCSFFVHLWHLEHSHSHGLHEWVTDETFFVSWISLWYDIRILVHPFSIGTNSHLWFPALHPSFACYTYQPVSLFLAFTLCQIMCTPRFPTEAGSRRACLLPTSVLLWEWLTSLLLSQVIMWNHQLSTYKYDWDYEIEMSSTCRWWSDVVRADFTAHLNSSAVTPTLNTTTRLDSMYAHPCAFSFSRKHSFRYMVKTLIRINCKCTPFCLLQQHYFSILCWLKGRTVVASYP